MEPGQTIGKYEIRRPLAQGGMAEVYVAVLRGAAGFVKPVALKRILPGLQQNIGEFEQMFAAEARLLAGLAHENIVQVLDFDRVGDLGFYIAMELVEGCDLLALARSAARAGRTLPVSLTVRIAYEVGAALLHAHTCADDRGQPLGLVHRDVSPQNVLLSRDGAVKLTDFGIAKVYAAAVGEGTRTGVLKGKFAYMSPEQTRGEPLDGRSDIFALGVVLWELLVGERLFRGADDLASLEAVRRKPVPPPSQRNHAVPPALDRIVAHCLERDLERRYPSAAELLRDLEALPVAELGQQGRESLARAVQERGEGRAAPVVVGPAFAAEPVSPGAPDAPTCGVEPTLEPTPEVAVERTPATMEDVFESRWYHWRPTLTLPVVLLLLIAFALVFGTVSDQDLYQNERERTELSPQRAETTAVSRTATAIAPEALVVDRPLGTDFTSAPEPKPVPTTVAELKSVPGRAEAPSNPTRDGLQFRAAKVQSVPHGARPRPPHGAKTTAPPRTEKAPPATLTINVTPWGYVSVDGKAFGQAPVAGLKLTPGSHRVRIEHPQLGHREHRVDLTPGDNGTILLRFTDPAPSKR